MHCIIDLMTGLGVIEAPVELTLSDSKADGLGRSGYRAVVE